MVGEPCPGCTGTGQTVQREQVTIRVPPGILEATTLRLPGHGEPSPVPGGKPGDAYVTVRTAADSRCVRRGADLWHRLDISVPDAALGTTATVLALDGGISIKVPASTQPGTILPVAGNGLPRCCQPGRGSLVVEIGVRIPAKLSRGQRRLYKQLRALETCAWGERDGRQ